MSTKKSLLFQLTDQVFSIPLSAVSEVIHKFSVVELPNPPKFFAGKSIFEVKLYRFTTWEKH